MPKPSKHRPKTIHELIQPYGLGSRLAIAGAILAVHVIAFNLADASYGRRGNPAIGPHPVGKVLEVRLLDRKALHPPVSEPPLSPLSMREPDLPGPPPQFDVKIGSPVAVIDLDQDAPVHYFPTTELTEKPVVKEDVSQDIALTLASIQSRTAVLRLLINDAGTIDQVIVEQGDFTEAEKQALITAAEQMRFTPGKIGGTVVNTEIRIEMTIFPAAPLPPLARPPQ